MHASSRRAGPDSMVELGDRSELRGACIASQKVLLDRVGLRFAQVIEPVANEPLE
jgi:hypothetical protein